MFKVINFIKNKKITILITSVILLFVFLIQTDEACFRIAYTASKFSHVKYMKTNDLKYAEFAEKFYRKALIFIENNPSKIFKKTVLLAELGRLKLKRNDFKEAEILTKESLKLRQNKLGENHILNAILFNNLGNVYLKQKKYGLAEVEYENGLKLFNPNAENQDLHSIPYTLLLKNLINLNVYQKKYSKAEAFAEQLSTFYAEKQDKSNYAMSLVNQALILKEQKKYTQSEALHKLALKQKPKEKYKIFILKSFASLYKSMNEKEKYNEVMQEIKLIEHKGV